MCVLQGFYCPWRAKAASTAVSSMPTSRIRSPQNVLGEPPRSTVTHATALPSFQQTHVQRCRVRDCPVPERLPRLNVRPVVQCERHAARCTSGIYHLGATVAKVSAVMCPDRLRCIPHTAFAGRTRPPPCRASYESGAIPGMWRADRFSRVGWDAQTPRRWCSPDAIRLPGHE
jgi:hypothetical protein